MLEMTNSQACLTAGEYIIKTRLNILSEIADSALDKFGEVVLLLVDVSVCFSINVSPTQSHRWQSDGVGSEKTAGQKKKINYLVSKRVTWGENLFIDCMDSCSVLLKEPG